MGLREQIAALPDERILSADEQAQMSPLDKYLTAFRAGAAATSATAELSARADDGGVPETSIASPADH